jgi:hypothetical protein
MEKLMTQPSNVINLAEVRAARAALIPPAAHPKQQVAQIAPFRPKTTPRVNLPTPEPSGSLAVRPVPAAPQPSQQLTWCKSGKGLWWVDDAGSGVHLVIYKTERGWSGRATPPSGRGWYVDLPRDIGSLNAAQEWAEEWLAQQREVYVAGRQA